MRPTSLAIRETWKRQIVNSDRPGGSAKALARMNENYRTVIELAYFEGLYKPKWPKGWGSR